MGVLIGDENVANLPSFVVAACDEIFDRLKNKIYEKKINLLSRVPASISGAQKIDDGSFLRDAWIYCSNFWNRILLLGVKKSRGHHSPTF